MEDVYNLFNSWNGEGNLWPERRYVYAQMCNIDTYLVEKSFQDILFKRHYCKTYNCPPFEGAYESHPDWWISAMMVIDRAESEAVKYRNKKK